MKRIGLTMLAALLVCALAGCGQRPAGVDTAGLDGMSVKAAVTQPTTAAERPEPTKEELVEQVNMAILTLRDYPGGRIGGGATVLFNGPEPSVNAYDILFVKTETGYDFLYTQTGEQTDIMSGERAVSGLLCVDGVAQQYSGITRGLSGEANPDFLVDIWMHGGLFSQLDPDGVSAAVLTESGGIELTFTSLGNWTPERAGEDGYLRYTYFIKGDRLLRIKQDWHYTVEVEGEPRTADSVTWLSIVRLRADVAREVFDKTVERCLN